jgi:hypothetical protein
MNRIKNHPARWQINQTGEFIILFTPDQFNNLPDGIELTNIFGSKYIKGTDYIDLDTRFGFLAYGIPEDEFNSEIDPTF